MIETMLPLAPERRAPLPAPESAPLVEQVATLRLENAALRAQNAALQQRIRELEAQLGQTSANSSRPPSSDPPQTRPRRRRVRKRSHQDENAAANRDTAGHSAGCCQSSK